MTDSNKNSNKRLLLNYAGLATQLVVSLAVGLFIGKWLDKKLFAGTPVLIWLLPLLVLVAILIRIIKDTSSKK